MNKYGPKAQKTIEQTRHKLGEGTLKSSDGHVVTDREQAVAIGISRARQKHQKVPKGRGDT